MPEAAVRGLGWTPLQQSLGSGAKGTLWSLWQVGTPKMVVSFNNHTHTQMPWLLLGVHVWLSRENQKDADYLAVFGYRPQSVVQLQEMPIRQRESPQAHCCIGIRLNSR